MRREIPQDYMERCYAGWLGKLIGVRHGAPIEGWTYDRILEKCGEITGYPIDYRMFAADDDTNGPVIFIRALNDSVCTRAITPQQIAETWMNYAPYQHGFYWWGGYGVSTENTAYMNLRAGIHAPRSGSAAQNGETVAEQIGGQIFIDSWGLVLPDAPELAAEYAAKAASVSHDGNAIYGGMYVAAAISAAFTAKSVREVMEIALAQIPADCNYAKVVRDVMRFHDEQSHEDWRQAFLYVRENWGYDKFGGGCHIIPNAAVMALAMVYGHDEFDLTLNICNMCGWDTDCNVGNVGTIMGVLVGLDGIDYKKWRAPINDVFVLSSVLGCLNIMDAPQCVEYLADLAYRMAGKRGMPGYQDGQRKYTFALPGSTRGFTAPGAVSCENVNGALHAVFMPEAGKSTFRFAKRTYYYPGDFHDDRYEPSFTPLLYPAQLVTARLRMPGSCGKETTAALYAHDRNSDMTLRGEAVKSGSEVFELQLRLPAGEAMLFDEVGVRFDGCTEPTTAELIEMRFSDNADYRIDFASEHTEVYDNHHRDVSQFTYYRGIWRLEGDVMNGSCAEEGETYTGDLSWRDYSLEGSVTRMQEGTAGLLVRVQGVIRSYGVLLDGTRLQVCKNGNGYRVIAETPFAAKLGQEVHLHIAVRGNRITVSANGTPLLFVTDPDLPYMNGCIGCRIQNGARALFRNFVIRPLI